MRTWLKQLAIALACYSLLSVVFAVQQVRAALMLQDRKLDFWMALWPMMGVNWIHGLLVPPVIAWSRWLEPHRGNLRRFLGWHAVGYFLYVGLFAVLRAGLLPMRHPLTGAVRPRSFALVGQVFFYNSADALFMYGPIAGITMAYLAYSRNRSREVELAKAELQILKMQLHPHFLFNTLQAISTLVGKDTGAAKRTIALLGDLLRAVIDRAGEQEVPLKDELDMLDRYAQIEQVRFGDRLTIDLDFESELLEYRVPSLILQPIVENAVKHGTEVRVAGALRAGRLVLTVADNGPGLPPEKDRRPGGLGLENTRARLRAMYGDRHSMDLRNRPEGGLLVTMEIPAR
jgi:two-component system LytT family sensor kinase